MSERGILEFLRHTIAANKEQYELLVRKEKQKRHTALLLDSGLGKRYWSCTFENYEVTPGNREAYEAAKTFAACFPNVNEGLLIYGPVGVGKTHLAAAIVNELLQKFYSVLFGDVVDIFLWLKERRTELTEQEKVRLVTEEIDLLVIDDLGKEKVTEYTGMMLYSIINKLYKENKPVVVTTNFTSAELRENLGHRGEAIISRLSQMCKVVAVTGKDWRIGR